MTRPRVLYCHCAYAQVIPKDVKESVLRSLCDSGLPFDAVADLCEMSARRDPSLKTLAGDGTLKIAACYPRAVKWLFNAAGAPLEIQHCEVVNMRIETAADASLKLVADTLSPNLPPDKSGPSGS